MDERYEYRVVDNGGSDDDWITESLEEAREGARSWDEEHPEWAPFVVQRRKVEIVTGEWEDA